MISLFLLFEFVFQGGKDIHCEFRRPPPSPTDRLQSLSFPRNIVRVPHPEACYIFTRTPHPTHENKWPSNKIFPRPHILLSIYSITLYYYHRSIYSIYKFVLLYDDVNYIMADLIELQLYVCIMTVLFASLPLQQPSI